MAVFDAGKKEKHTNCHRALDGCHVAVVADVDNVDDNRSGCISCLHRRLQSFVQRVLAMLGLLRARQDHWLLY